MRLCRAVAGAGHGVGANSVTPVEGVAGVGLKGVIDGFGVSGAALHLAGIDGRAERALVEADVVVRCIRAGYGQGCCICLLYTSRCV